MPCHNCLKILNYNDYLSIKTPAIFRQNFDFLAFFNGDYQTKFTKLPEYVGQNKGGYTEDWSTISRNFKKAKTIFVKSVALTYLGISIWPMCIILMA